MTRDKWWQAKFAGFVSWWKQFLSLKNCRSVRIRSVLNRSNQDTTVYCCLIVCAFSWPNKVKWCNSGIIKHIKSCVWIPLWCCCSSGNKNNSDHINLILSSPFISIYIYIYIYIYMSFLCIVQRMCCKLDLVWCHFKINAMKKLETRSGSWILTILKLHSF